MTTATKRVPAKNVDEYLQTFPPSVRTTLSKIRRTIQAAAPGAEEKISYGIPGYQYKGMLIYFAGFKNHVSVYPAPRTAEPFKKLLAAYKGGKGTVQFPLDKTVPLTLIKKMVQYRIKINEEKTGTGKNHRSGKTGRIS
jgi:uncharacterized protein YdhG (YjbR/CyaY superfamily)